MRIYAKNGAILSRNGKAAFLMANWPFLRCRFSPGYVPTMDMGMKRRLVNAAENIWDIYNAPHVQWVGQFRSNYYLLEIIDGDLSNAGNGLHELCWYCTGLTSVKVYLGSQGSILTSAFRGCTSLRSVTIEGDIYDMYQTFYDCRALTDVNILGKFLPTISPAGSLMRAFYGCRSITTIPLFDTSNCLNTGSMFQGCTSLTSVPLFDTSSVTYMGYMFQGCTSLTSIPLFDTSRCYSMVNAFYDCTNVQSGALALYRQASSQTSQIVTNHDSTFHNCGINTVTGAAELAQIPDDWK